MSPLDDSAAAVARLTGALERQAEELRSVRSLLGLGPREDCRLLRADEVAARLVKSRAWVYRNQHTLGGFRVGGQVRFEAAAIEAYLERCRQQSPAVQPPRDGSPARLLPLVGHRERRGGRTSPPSA